METGLFMLLSVVSVPTLAVAGLLGLLLSARWRAASVTAIAVAVGLSAVAITALVLFWLEVSPLLYFPTVLSVPPLTYGWVHRFLATRCKVEPDAQSTGLALGLFPLFVIGFYFWVSVGCIVAKECL